MLVATQREAVPGPLFCPVKLNAYCCFPKEHHRLTHPQEHFTPALCFRGLAPSALLPAAVVLPCLRLPRAPHVAPAWGFKKNIQRPSYFDSRANAGKSQCANLVLSTLNKKNTDFSKQNTTKLRAPSKPLEVHGIPFIDSAERWIRQQTRTPHIQRDPYYLAYDCFQFHGPLISYGFP